jgi:cytochrome P450
MARAGETAGVERPAPPGPDGLPLLGNALQLVRDPFGFIDDVGEYGDVVSYHLAGIRFTALLHPDHVEQVLVGDPDPFRRWTGDEWNVLGEFAPEGLLLSEGEQWRRQRVGMQPMFTPDRIESYTDAMGEYADRMVDEWDDGETVAINRETSRLALRILARSLFDLDVSGQDDVVTRAAAAINDRADSRSLGTFLPRWIPTRARRRSRRAMAVLDDLLDDRIAERRRAPEAHDDLLAFMLSADGPDGGFTEAEVRDNLVTFLFAGHETTSLALAYTLFLLATNPEQRATLDEELDAVLGGEPPTPTDLPELTYLDRVITEALRLYPPAYVLFREAVEDTTVGGYAVPEGSKLSLPIYNIHHDQRWYDDPEAFRPGRWTDVFEESLPEYAYFPFGGGPRHCIGMRFARMELMHVLPTVLQRTEFELESDPEIDFQLGVTLQPTDDIRLRVRKR